MRGAGVSALLIVCLVTFLCPEMAKPNVVTMWRRHIAAQQLLHSFVLDADPFLPDLRWVLYPAF
jgi:hypothetical protein